jgi:hypothetical protein
VNTAPLGNGYWQYDMTLLAAPAERRRTTEWHQRVTGMTLQGRWVVEDTATGQRRYRVLPSTELR